MPTVPGSVSDGLPQACRLLLTRTRPRTATAGRTAQLMMGMVVVGVMMSVMVVVVMRRVRQRDVGEKNQCDREANNLTHDSISNP